MKKTIMLFLSITVLLIAFAGCNSNEAQSKKSGASGSVSVALKPDYYPQNTFSDVDSDYAYFAVAKSIYKKSRSENPVLKIRAVSTNQSSTPITGFLLLRYGENMFTSCPMAIYAESIMTARIINC